MQIAEFLRLPSELWQPSMVPVLVRIMQPRPLRNGLLSAFYGKKLLPSVEGALPQFIERTWRPASVTYVFIRAPGLPSWCRVVTVMSTKNLL